ncbi:UNVERIFIED_CONTAM: putative E3 ubiquitin-protein ligase RHA4A [Sesamum radiatum]|uniref:RING-type E3 ubiquitin transferase n=1 Tax=Sesamum radiatum TaxID=300843 RepID=A0AAW2QIU7_SESRA
MDSPQSQSPPRQYPEAIQIKLYQAFIFSIPILFSVILFLLFYLFYLKRRASGISSTPPRLPRTIHDTNITTTSDSDLKNELNNKLCTVLFDEDMEARDSLCCVCLGEFEVKEELVQVPSCKHIFHIDCLRRWLLKNSTCPLCRSPVVSGNNSGSHHHQPPTSPANLMLVNRDSNNHQGGGTSAIATAVAA